jgi:hypothetical protein
MVRRTARWKSSLGCFVREYTVRQLIASLGGKGIRVTPHAVYSWISGRAAPRPNAARAVVLVSGGRVCLDDIYGRRPQHGAKGECFKSR